MDDILARAGNVGHSHLGSFAESAEQRDRPRRMAADAYAWMCNLPAVVESHRQDHRNADVACQIEDANLEPGRRVLPEQRCAVRLFNARDVDARRLSLSQGSLMPEACRVALNQLAQSVARRLEDVVARGEPVGAHREAARLGSAALAPVDMHHFVRHQQVSARHEIARLNPKQRHVPAEGSTGQHRQPFDVGDGSLACHLVMAAQPERQLHVLAVPGLDRFHQPRRPGRHEVKPLAVEDRARAAVGPAHHHHREAEPVEASQIGNPGDTELGHPRPHALDRKGRLAKPVRAPPKGLAGVFVSPCLRHASAFLIRSAEPSRSGDPAPRFCR